MRGRDRREHTSNSLRRSLDSSSRSHRKAARQPFRPELKWDGFFTCCKEDSFIGNFIPLDLRGGVESWGCKSDADCLSCDEDDAEDVENAKCNLIGLLYPGMGSCSRTSTARDASICTGTGHPERSDVNEYPSRLTVLANDSACLDQKWHDFACVRSQTSRRLRSEEAA